MRADLYSCRSLELRSQEGAGTSLLVRIGPQAFDVETASDWISIVVGGLEGDAASVEIG